MPEEADKVIKQMQNDIKAVLFHSCCIESNDERHKYCPPGKDSWCKYKRTGTFENKDHHLAALFLEFLMPIFDRLSDQSLLRRCLPGLSQNRNESLNSLVWVRDSLGQKGLIWQLLVLFSSSMMVHQANTC